MTVNHQDSRLHLIDFCMTFIGYASRKNLVEHFGVATATASRDFKLYEELHSEQIRYNIRSRRYEREEAFSPAYYHDLSDALLFLTTHKWVIPYNNPNYHSGLTHKIPDGLNIEITSGITRAIASTSVIKVDYASATSGFSTRVMAPHSLLTNGMGWYVRAFDHKSNEFRNFRLSRFLKITETCYVLESNERQNADHQWKETVTLTLAPHPKHANQDAFRRDLGLTDKPVLNINVSLAMVGFVLSAMRVDCSEAADMDIHQFPLRCMNLHDLKDVESLQIAPGYHL